MATRKGLTGKLGFCARTTLLLIGVALAAACGKPAVLARPPEPAPKAEQAPSPPVATAPAPAQEEAPPKPQVKEKNLAVVQVYYATDRTPAGQSAPAKVYGAGRGSLSYGSCEVAVPRDQRLARFEPATVGRLEYSERPGNRPTLRRVAPREYESYLAGLRGAVAKAPKKSALVFVHGYNVSFAEGARRTAQLKYDLAFDGPAILFSWPSKGKTDAYAADEADVEWAQPDLKDFLKELAWKTKVKNIYLIGQGMGSRALAKAFIYLASEKPELAKAFRELILVAPDIDSDLFYQDIAPALAETPVHTTLYASSKDPALRVAGQFQQYPRAGHSGDRLVVVDGIETIDATGVDTSLTRHSWVGENSSVAADIYRLIRHGKSAAERPGIRTVKAASGRYWKFKER